MCASCIAAIAQFSKAHAVGRGSSAFNEVAM
jgi:hypothetical protein